MAHNQPTDNKYNMAGQKLAASSSSSLLFEAHLNSVDTAIDTSTDKNQVNDDFEGGNRGVMLNRGSPPTLDFDEYSRELLTNEEVGDVVDEFAPFIEEAVDSYPGGEDFHLPPVGGGLPPPPVRAASDASDLAPMASFHFYPTYAMPPPPPPPPPAGLTPHLYPAAVVLPPPGAVPYPPPPLSASNVPGGENETSSKSVTGNAGSTDNNSSSINNKASTDSTNYTDHNNKTTSTTRQPVPFSRRKKKPPGMPKRPLSAYNLYFQAERAKILARQNESGHHGPRIGFEGLGKIIGKQWRDLRQAEKRKYDKLAETDSERYRKEMETYNEMKKKRYLEEDEAYASSPAVAAAAVASQRPTLVFHTGAPPMPPRPPPGSPRPKDNSTSSDAGASMSYTVSASKGTTLASSYGGHDRNYATAFGQLSPAGTLSNGYLASSEAIGGHILGHSLYHQHLSHHQAHGYPTPTFMVGGGGGGVNGMGGIPASVAAAAGFHQVHVPGGGQFPEMRFVSDAGQPPPKPHPATSPYPSNEQPTQLQYHHHQHHFSPGSSGGVGGAYPLQPFQLQHQHLMPKDNVPLPPGMEIVLSDRTGIDRKYRVQYACYSMTREGADKYIESLMQYTSQHQSLSSGGPPAPLNTSGPATSTATSVGSAQQVFQNNHAVAAAAAGANTNPSSTGAASDSLGTPQYVASPRDTSQIQHAHHHPPAPSPSLDRHYF